MLEKRQEDTLRRNIRMSYRCEICGEVFKYKLNKNRHDREHEKEKIWLPPARDDMQL